RNLEKTDRNSVSDYLTQIDARFSILAGPRDYQVWENASPDAGARVLDLLSLGHDFVVVDTSGAMDRYTRALVEASTLVLIVTTGEVSSVRDTKAALERLRNWGVPDDKVKVVLNRGARAEGFRVSDLEKTLARPVFWELPRDRGVSRSVQLGRPIVVDNPRAAASRHILALAATIGGNVSANGAQAPKQSGGLVGLFRGRDAKKVTL